MCQMFATCLSRTFAKQVACKEAAELPAYGAISFTKKYNLGGVKYIDYI